MLLRYFGTDGKGPNVIAKDIGNSANLIALSFLLFKKSLADAINLLSISTPIIDLKLNLVAIIIIII